jgi:DNA processing protein
MANFNRIEDIHRAEVGELSSIEGLGEKRSQKIFESSNNLDEAEDFISSLEAQNIKYCTSLDKTYPALFEELNDPPPIIFFQGELPETDEKTVAIVGSHNATPEGVSYAVDLAMMFAKRSVSVVSGLARGIDTAAHIGCRRGGGRTYAVIGSGFNHLFPAENRALANEIIQNGALISEYTPDTQTTVGRLMARNRLIVGLSQAVVIGEIMADSSGTMDTATFCHEVGKIMFILLDGCDRPNWDNSAVEKVLHLGAIPFYLNDGIDLIIKSLV